MDQEQHILDILRCGLVADADSTCFAMGRHQELLVAPHSGRHQGGRLPCWSAALYFLFLFGYHALTCGMGFCTCHRFCCLFELTSLWARSALLELRHAIVQMLTPTATPNTQLKITNNVAHEGATTLSV